MIVVGPLDDFVSITPPTVSSSLPGASLRSLAVLMVRRAGGRLTLTGMLIARISVVCETGLAAILVDVTTRTGSPDSVMNTSSFSSGSCLRMNSSAVSERPLINLNGSTVAVNSVTCCPSTVAGTPSPTVPVAVLRRLIRCA